jgi:putative ABC transport system permease protein
MLKNYFKIAYRFLLRRIIFSLINICGLTIGITAAVFIMLWVQNELTFDSYHPGANRIYRIAFRDSADHNSPGYMEWTPLLLADASKREIPGIEKTAKLFIASWAVPIIDIKGEVFSENKYAFVDGNWFNMFHYEFLNGDANSFKQKPHSVILTSSKAKVYFGKKEALGQNIMIDSIYYEVQAVVKDPPPNSSFQFDMLLPISAYLEKPGQREQEEAWSRPDYMTFVQLHNNNDSAGIAKKLDEILRRNTDNGKISTRLLPLTSIHFETTFPFSPFPHVSKKPVYIFSSLAILLLLVASINYVNLTTSRANIRAKEVSIRKIVGARRMQLFGQFIAESLLINFLALLGTLTLVHVCLPLFNSLTEEQFVLPFWSASLWQILLGTLFASFLMNSIYPAILLSSFNPLHVFRGMTIPKMKDISFRKTLVIVQFTISIGLIAGTMVIIKQLNFIWQTDANYNRAQIFYFSLPLKSYLQYSDNKRKSLMNTIRQELLMQSSIEEVSIASNPGINIQRSFTGADWVGRNKDFNPVLASLNADESFQKLFNLYLLEGRWFNPGNQEDKKNYILNETAEKEFNIKRPVIGQWFTLRGDTGRIIGVVKDFHYTSLYNKIGPLVILIHAETSFTFIVKTNPGKISEALLGAKHTWNTILPEYPFNYTFMDEAFDNLYLSEKKTSKLVLIFSGIAIFISILGLFALSTFTAEQRTKEIGIRKVLGATVSNITFLLSRNFIKLVSISILIATPISWLAMNKWLQGFAYRINIGWGIFVEVGGGTLLIALITISFQAIKAAIANPVRSLRSE